MLRIRTHWYGNAMCLNVEKKTLPHLIIPMLIRKRFELWVFYTPQTREILQYYYPRALLSVYATSP